MNPIRWNKGAVYSFGVILIIVILSGCEKDVIVEEVKPVIAPNDPELRVSNLSLALVKDGVQEIVVDAMDEQTNPEGFTAIIKNEGIVAVSISGKKVTVTGVDYGKTTLSIITNSGKKRDIPVNVYNHRVLETDELLITFLQTFENRYYRYDGSKARSFHHPVETKGFHPLGSIGCMHFSATGNTGVMGVKAKEGFDPNHPPIKHPVDYEAIIYLRQDGGYKGAFWMPVAPVGYVAMGVVVTAGERVKPSTSEVVCVREDLTMKGTIADNFIMRVADTYTTTWPFQNTRVWATWNIEGPVADFHENAYLQTGTFVAVNSGKSSNPREPINHPVINVLKVKLPMLTEEIPFDQYVPCLTGRETPPEETSPVLAREMLVPANIIKDPYYEIQDAGSKRIAESPFYRLERHVFWKKIHFINNTTNIEQGGSYKIIHGIEVSESQKAWKETGVEISAEAGVSIKGVDAKVSTTVSRSMGYEKMTGISQLEHSERSVDFRISPNKAGAIYQQHNRFVLRRHIEEGKSLEVVNVWEIPQISYVIVEYPGEK